MYFGNSNYSTDKSADILIGSDFYYNIVTDNVCREPLSCSVAVDCILGWVLCGPIQTRKIKRQENVNFITSITVRIETKTIERNLKKELNKFWKTKNEGSGELAY